MRILSVLACMSLLLAIGASDAKAQDKIASLPDTPSQAVAPSVAEAAPGYPAAYPAGMLAAIGLSALEVQGIHHAIRGQIRALTARDSETAFSHLTPVIQDYFAEPSAFEKSLAKNAWPILAVRDFTFVEIEREATDAIQHVLLTDAQGKTWDAAFKMERQSDGRWAIRSCLVGPSKGPSV